MWLEIHFLKPKLVVPARSLLTAHEGVSLWTDKNNDDSGFVAKLVHIPAAASVRQVGQSYSESELGLMDLESPKCSCSCVFQS